jgi:valyl-tRNA synthetase
MEKTFDPASIEPRISAKWEQTGAFKAGREDRRGAEPYTIVIPPPNVTGSLHMGHALNNTIQDILCRYNRMKGKDVLWQPGTDHAGIATQMVVERKLAAEGKDRRDMGREAFLQEVWKQKEESEAAIIGQLKKLGASCDWSRLRFTLDDGLSKAVTKVFVDLYNKGLIYKDKRLVNWDPKLQTAISDLEVVQVEKRGSFSWKREDGELDVAVLNTVLNKDPHGHLYYINYPLEGAVYDPDDESTYIQIATTRPETMLGDTGIAVNPENEKLRHLIGRKVIVPFVGRVIPIVGDDYADPEKGTGAVKITPAHDFNDAEVGKRHRLDAINIFNAQASIDTLDIAEINQSSFLHDCLENIDRYEVRMLLVAKLYSSLPASAEKGFLAKIEPTTHMVPHGDRSNVAIEPFLTDQWYVNVKPMAENAMDAVRQGKTRFVPQNWEKTYFQWLETIEPWCVSRQLWWGHQIPVWYSFTPDQKPILFVTMTESEALDEAEKLFGAPVEIIDNFSGTITRAARVRAGKAEKYALYRDPDVLDTWFSSALWPFSTLGWPETTPELTRHCPTDVLVTGFDIIFFWVARMMMMGLEFQEEVPFKDIYIHALVRDASGAKMSKSKGNVIDPLQIIEQYGADALRFTLAAMAAQGRDIKLSLQRVEGYRNFATKLWNAARFAEMNGCGWVAGFEPQNVQLTLNQWAISEAAKAIHQVSQAIESYRFNEAAGAAYRFVWNVFCDWYLELAKPILQGADGPEKNETRATIAWVLDQICLMLHPFMPFITEELWGEETLALSRWPEGLNLFINEEAEAEIGWVIDLVSDIRSARAETNIPASLAIPLQLIAAEPVILERVRCWESMILRLAKLESIIEASTMPEAAIQLLVRGTLCALPLEGVIDLDAEKARLAKEKGKLEADIAKIDAKLSNAEFLKKAPEEVVEEQNERREDAQSRLVKVREALARL